MIKGGISGFKGKRILMLQGPLGPFFKRLARDLTKIGAQVSKINFNGGDLLFFPTGAITFRGHIDQWPAFLEQILSEKEIDIVLLFGDCRLIHRIAHEVATKRGIEVGVFEEGYVRPDYITLERFGVNGNSQIFNTPEFYFNTPKIEIPPTINVGNTFWHTVFWAILYYQASTLLWPFFRRYKHHRPLTILEGLPWLRSMWRKCYFAFKEKGIQKRLASTLSKQYFLVALQVHNDAQLRVHSDFESVDEFITDVLYSFAKFASNDTNLVIKHHPMDRGYCNYSKTIRNLSLKLGIFERVYYIHDQHLPTLLENARGVVLINSTVGLSALHHGTPLKVCGKAIYDLQGLTCQDSLDDFWQKIKKYQVDPVLLVRFRNYLIEHTQLNGNFYRRLNIADSCSGLVWTKSTEEFNIVNGVDVSAYRNCIDNKNKIIIP